MPHNARQCRENWVVGWVVRMGMRALARLSALRVTKAKVPGFYEDGGGLRLIVTEKGIKRWALRLSINGRRVERGLGLYPGVSLEAARLRAVELRHAARQGIDLQLKEKAMRNRMSVTFRDAFDQFFEVRRQRLSNGKHIQQWENTMRDYAYPVLGDLPVADITAAEVLQVLTPIWFSKSETASRLLQRISATFDSAILRGTRVMANPCVGIAAELGVSHRKVQHHPALNWRDVPTFYAQLDEREMRPITRMLFKFLILTASRSGEARGAMWNEIDPKEHLWTIPGSRMKAGHTHVVPLSRAAVAILSEARTLFEERLIFSSASGKPISDNTLSKAMRDWNMRATPHGFRSAFKDWAAESGTRDEVSEAALAHADRNRVRSAYRRTNYLEERIELMEKWSTFVTAA